MALAPFAVAMTFQRAAAELESGGERVNIVARATNLDLEKRLLPIRIPLDKGLLGVRMFLIMAETQPRLDAVRTLDELRQFTIGQSSSWSDVHILQSAGFKLVLSDAYAPLFAMLGARRFDLFSRGAIEIEAEWNGNRAKIPGLMIERRFLLHYPMPRYFFVPRTAQGARMAERIEDGLHACGAAANSNAAIRPGRSWCSRISSSPAEKSSSCRIRELSAETPLTDKYWWDDLAAEVGAAH